MSQSQTSASTERSLANLKPWQTGRSGNPAGRPKAPADVTELARKYGPRAVAVIGELLGDRDARIRLAAANSLLDRGYGKPAQSVNVDGSDGNSNVLMHLLAAKAIARLEAENALPTLEAKVVADETTAPATNVSTPPQNIFEPASE